MKIANNETTRTQCQGTAVDCNGLLTSIAVNLFLLESSLSSNSPAVNYLSRIKQDLSEAHFLVNAGKKGSGRLKAASH